MKRSGLDNGSIGQVALALLTLGLTIVAEPRHGSAADLSLATPTVSVLYPRIVNGQPTSAYAETGALLMYGDASASMLDGLCSGTLIGCRTFLTAAHCVCPDGAYDATSCLREGTTDPSTLRVFLPQGGSFSVAHVTISPDYSFGERGDVAIVALDESVQGIAPAPINTLRRTDAGTTGTIVGFGTTYAGHRAADDAGVKRQGTIQTSTCPSDLPSDTHVCWSFSGSASNTCEGDSGGPLFVDFGSGPVVAGVTSGGNSFDCLAPDVGFDSDVFVNLAWIVANAGADLGTASCGLPAVGTTATTTDSHTAQLSGSFRQLAVTVDVPAGTAVLRVGMNGQLGSNVATDRANDFDLFVRAGSAPSALVFDCADTNASPFGFCEIAAPQAGTWHVLVNRQSGDGSVQLTATTFASTALCGGDCNRDGDVTVDEVLEGVRIALGSDDLAACPAFNSNSDGVVTVDELLGAVTSALNGCSAS